MAQTSPEREPSQSSRWLPTTQVAWAALAVGIVAGLNFLLPIKPHDFWYNMAVGRLTWETGQIPSADPFSFTQHGEPFFAQAWLSQVSFHLLYSLGGAALVLCVHTLFVTAAYVLLLLLCVRRGASWRLASILCLAVAVPLSASNWNVRPQSFTFVLCLVVLHVLTHWRQQAEPSFFQSFFRGWLWTLPLVILLWVNVHASFVVGCFLILLTFVAEAARRLLRRWPPRWSYEAENGNGNDSSLPAVLVAGALSACMILVNPTGWGLVEYALQAAGDPARRTNSIEWRPPVVTEAQGTGFYAATLLLLGCVALSRRRLPLVELLWVGGFFWLALQGVRYIIWFAFVATPSLAYLLGTRDLPNLQAGAAERQRSWFNLVIVCAVIAAVAVLSPPLKPIVLRGRFAPLVDRDTPVAAVEKLRSLPNRPTRLMHSSSNGSYLMWAAPEQGVFIDSRLQDFYRPEIIQDYMTLQQGRRIAELTAKYRLNGMLLCRDSHSALIEALSQPNSEWNQVYSDKTHLIFVKP